MKKLSAADFAAWCRKQYEDNCGYIMGAVGQAPETLREWYFSGQYRGKQLEKANYWRANAPRVYDCQGLADGYLSEMLGEKIDVRARNNYTQWCGERGEGMIPAGRRVPGAAVFKRDNYIHHVGFLSQPVEKDRPDGDWYVIEAKGVMYGVVRTRLMNGGWNAWGLMDRYFDYGQAEASPGQTRLLKRGMSGSDVAALQLDLIALGYSCGKFGADGEFGAATESALKTYQTDLGLKADGILGEKTRAELDKDLTERSETLFGAEDTPQKARILKGSWYVREQPDPNAPKLGVVRCGQLLPHTGRVTDGWIGVRLGEENGWVSRKGAVVE